MSEDDPGIGRRYLQETRYTRAGLGERGRLYPRGEPYKEYPAATRRVKLNPQAGRRPLDLWDCLKRRRSQRQYRERPLTQEELAALLWATQGISLAVRNFLFRTAPSAGALYPVETYVAVLRVEGLEPGIWHFNVPEFSLELLSAGQYGPALAAACLSQNFMATAAVDFIWTGILNRCQWKYRERAIRYVFLDAGHICQNLMLAATALELGCCPVGAFFDEEVERLLGVDGEEEVALYLAAVGPL
jgi:SagB-type dehydrogenase family enzyme